MGIYKIRKKKGTKVEKPAYPYTPADDVSALTITVAELKSL